MSQKVTQGKSGVVGPKKSDQLTISHGVVSDSQSKSGPNETEPLSSEMETVIIQGTDFAKEFEKPNDRASHIKIGRAKQKIVGNQGAILQYTSVSVTSGNNNKNNAKLNAVSQKTAVVQSVETAAKKNDGPCRTSDLEGSAAGSCAAAAKTNCKKPGDVPTATTTTTVPAPGAVATTIGCAAIITAASVRKDGSFVGGGRGGNAQLVNTSCIHKGKIITRPAPPIVPPPPPLRPNDNSKTMGRNSSFSNMRPVVPNPGVGGIFPTSTPPPPPPRGVRNPGSNFNTPRPGVCVPGNLYGRPNVPMGNVRNARQMAMVNRFNNPRPVVVGGGGGILVRPTGSPLMRPTCPGNKNNQLIMSNVSNIVNQKMVTAGCNKQNVKPNSNTTTTAAAATTTTATATPTISTTTINNVNMKTNVTFANSRNNKALVSDGNSGKANIGRNLVKLKPESNKVISEVKNQVNASNSNLDLDVSKKISNNKSANVGGAAAAAVGAAAAGKSSDNGQVNVASNKSNSVVKVPSSAAVVVHAAPPSSSSVTNDKLTTTTTTTTTAATTTTTTTGSSTLAATTTHTATALKASQKPSGGVSTTSLLPNVVVPVVPVASVSGELQTSSTETKQKEHHHHHHHPSELTGVEESCDALDDYEGSKSGISFSFCRKMGQKLSCSVPFGKERDEKLLHSGETEREPKESRTSEEPIDSLGKGDVEKCEKSSEEKAAAKDLPPAGMPFLKVLNKEQTLELDWPVEMIQYTKTQPSITFSCNPLFFDFSELLPKNKSQKSDDASKSKVKGKSDETSTLKVEVNSFVNKDDLKENKSLTRKSKKKKRKLSTQRHSDEDEPKTKKKKKKHKKKEHKTEEGVSGKDDGKNVSVEGGKSKRHKKKKKKKKRSQHSGTKSDPEVADGSEAVRSKSSHKSKHKKHKSRKSKKKRHKTDDFEKQSQSGRDSEEEPATGPYVGLKNKQLKKRKPQLKTESGNISSEDEAAMAATESKVPKVHKTKVKLVGVDRSELVEPDSKQSTAGSAAAAAIPMCEEEKPDLSKKRLVGIGNNAGPLLESTDDCKKVPKDESVCCVKAGSSSERKHNSGDVDSPLNSKRKVTKGTCIKSEDTWSKMENLFEARFDPEGNKASWDTSSDSDVESPVNKNNNKNNNNNNTCLKSKSKGDTFKRKKNGDESVQTDKKETNNKNNNNSNNNNNTTSNSNNNNNSNTTTTTTTTTSTTTTTNNNNNNNNNNSKSAFSSSTSKVDSSRIENYHQSSGSDTDQPCSVKKSYKRKKCYSGGSHHSESQCRSREHSYSSSYSDRDSHYSHKSKHRHSRSHSSSNSRSRSRSRSRSVSYERHGSHRGRRYSYSSYSEDDYRYRRRRTASRSCSRHRSRSRSSSYSHSRRYRSYSSEHRSYTSSSSRSRSRSESRRRSRSYSYSRSHSKSSSYSRSRSRSRSSYHKSHSKSRSPHKSKSDYRHKSSPEPRYSSSYSSKKYSRSVHSKKNDNDKSGKLDPAKIPMPGDIKDGGSDQLDKSKGKSSGGESTKSTSSQSEASAALNSVASKTETAAQGSSATEPKPSSGGLKNIPLPPFQVTEAAPPGPDNQTRPPPPPPQLIPPPRFPAAASDSSLLHPLPDLSQPPPSASIIPNCPPPPPPPPPPLNLNMPALPPARMGVAPSLYGHLGLPSREPTPMNVPPPPPPPRTPLPFTPRSVTRLEQNKDGSVTVKPALDQSMQSLPATPTLLPLVVECVEKEMTPPLPPPKSPPPQPPPPPKKEDEKKSCEDISPMPLPIIPPEQAEQYKHLQEMAQKHAQKQQRRQHQKETGQVEESDDDESMEMEGQVSTVVSDEEIDEQPGILALPEPEPQHLQQQILLPQAQHAGSPVIAHHSMVPFCQQQQIMIPQNALLQSQGSFPIQAGGQVIAIPQMSHGAAHHHHPHHPHHHPHHHHPHHHPHHHHLAGHPALHHLHASAAAAAAAAGLPIAAAAHPFHHRLIAAPSQLMPMASPQPLLTQIHPPGSIIIGHQVYIPRFPRAPI